MTTALGFLHVFYEVNVGGILLCNVACYPCWGLCDILIRCYIGSLVNQPGWIMDSVTYGVWLRWSAGWKISDKWSEVSRDDTRLRHPNVTQDIQIKTSWGWWDLIGICFGGVKSWHLLRCFGVCVCLTDLTVYNASTIGTFLCLFLPRFVIYPGKLSKYDSFRIGALWGVFFLVVFGATCFFLALPQDSTWGTYLEREVWCHLKGDCQAMFFPCDLLLKSILRVFGWVSVTKKNWGSQMVAFEEAGGLWLVYCL